MAPIPGKTSDTVSAAMADRWSFNRVGPFHALQRRLGLISDTDLAVKRRALLFAALAFVPALLLAWPQGYALNEHHERALLFDFSAYALVVAIMAFVVMEQSADHRMRQLIRKFAVHGLVPPGGASGFDRARVAMERRTGAWWAEALLLVAAFWLGYLWQYRVASHIDGGTWVGRVVEGRFDLTLAGGWAVTVMVPLFLFLLGRWLWRFFTWGLLLRDVARCELRLVATHADRCGGLAFIGQYPKTYMLFVFALSTLLSAGVAKHVVYAGASLASFKFAALGVIVFLVVAFVLPLLAFAPLLKRLKYQGLTLYGGLISQHNLAFERKWFVAEQQAQGDEALGSPDMSSLADLSMSYDMVKRMLPIPIVKEGIVPLVGAALLPMVAVAATQMPIKQVLAGLKGLLLL